MTVHVGDVGTVVTQALTETDSLASSGATVLLRIRRPDGTSTSVAGTAAADHVEAVIGAGVWTLPGTYQLQFEVTIDATSFALDRQTAQVQSRISAPAPPLSVDELRSNFLRGLPMEDPMTRVPFPDSFYEFHIQSAVAYLERMLDIPLTLRTIEGRLRLLDARARHDFPDDPAEQRTLAHLLGAAGPDALAADVQALTARIRTTFERIFDQTVAAM